MFNIFSGLPADEKLGTDYLESGKTVDRNNSSAKDLIKIFDGTEFVKSSITMSQDFDPAFYNVTDEDVLTTFDNLLKNFPSPPYNADDPVLGSEHFGNLYSSGNFLGSQMSIDGTLSSNLTANQEVGNSFITLEPVSSSMQHRSEQQQQYYPPQTVSNYVPSVAFSNTGLLSAAPEIDDNGNGGKNTRLVKFNNLPQQQKLRSNPSPGYTPPPTPGSSKALAANPNSRGAQYARQYRQKNREHVELLEGENNRLQMENERLRKAYENACFERDKFNREVIYLRQVLQNQSAIASVLNAVNCNAPGLKLQFPVNLNGNTNNTNAKQEAESRRTVETRASSKRKTDDQQISQQQPQSKRVKANAGSVDGTSNGGAAGICLHVNGDTVSVEFCARCNREARCVNEHQQ